MNDDEQQYEFFVAPDGSHIGPECRDNPYEPHIATHIFHAPVTDITCCVCGKFTHGTATNIIKNRKNKRCEYTGREP